MKPEDVVTQLLGIVLADSEVPEAKIFEALTDAGVSAKLADRAYKFAQIACSRKILAAMGVRFSPDYVCFDAHGNVTESGHLVNEPCFATALALCERHAGSPALQRLAMSSADAQSVNQALRGGATPDKLVMAAAFVFVEPPTPAGLENAQKFIAQHLRPPAPGEPIGPPEPAKSPEAAPAPAAAKSSEAGRRGTKPWWRFWN